LNRNNAIEWHEYFAMLQTFAQWDFGGCTFGQSDSAPLLDQFLTAACSCQGYYNNNTSTRIANATTTVLSNCTCAKEEATVAIPGIYPEPYVTNVCQGIVDILDAVCKAVPFQPKPLHTVPSSNETEDEFPVTETPSVSPLSALATGTTAASSTEPKRRNIVPIVASVTAVAAYLAFMAVLYVQNGRHVRHVSQSAEKWSHVASRPRTVTDDHDGDGDDDDCTHNDDNLSHAEMPIDVEVGSVGNQSGDTGLLTKVDFRMNNSEECVVFDPALYDSANEPLFDRSQSSSDLSLHHRHAADTTSSMSLADTTSWLVKSFEKSEFGHPSFNYNDVSAPICNPSLLDYNPQRHGASSSLSDDDEYGDSMLGYTDESGDDGDTDDDSSDEGHNHHLTGPIDLDNGDEVVMPPKRRPSKAMQKRKKKLPKVRSVKGTREAYMKKAEARSSNSLKPIPEASLIRSKPFII
jgi:hypothetical protein